MTRLIICGDLHGNTNAAKRVVDKAVQYKADVILQVGDFGLWPGYGGIAYLDELNAHLMTNNRYLIWTDGNHEDFDQLDRYVQHNPRDSNGNVYIRSRILYAPRGNDWTWAGKRFMAVGGAASIDRHSRIEGKSWWSGEQLTDQQVEGIVNRAHARRAAGKPEVDYLITHDCSDKTPFRFNLVPDPDSKSHRQKMDKVLNAVRPKMHFHGHMHARYDWQNPTAGSGMFGDPQTVWTQTYGLKCDGEMDVWGLLNTKTDKFMFASDIAKAEAAGDFSHR